MLRAIKTLADQFEWGWRASMHADLGLRIAIKRLVVCGMGGSAFPAELLKLNLWPDVSKIEVFRGYSPPSGVLDSESLAVVSSFSGNTEETLSCYARARSLGGPMVAMTSGGELERLALLDEVPLIRLPRPWETFQPRAATGMFVGALSALCDVTGLAAGLRRDLFEVSASLREFNLDQAMLDAAVRTCSGRIPLFLACGPRYAPLAKVAKIKINENAKMAAFWNYLPEMNHNELEGFTTSPRSIVACVLEKPNCSPPMQRRIRATLKTLASLGVPVVRVPSWNTHPLTHAFTQLLFVDHLSLGLAAHNGVEPNPVPTIESFKALLTQE